MRVVVADPEEILRKLSIHDGCVDALAADDRANLAASALDERAYSLVQLGALVAIDAAPPTYMDVIDSARSCGVSEEEIVGALIAVIPAVGVARVVSAAPKLALALGYDVGAALENRT
jgi:alkylhydroperoxidase/carboxymuconolactone decarboxylase family protein YurZ